MVQTTFEGKPDWYGGPEGALKTSIERARDLAAAKFQPYKQQRVAGFSPQQQQSFNLAERYSQPTPQYGQAQGAITGALGQDIYGQNVQPYLEEGARAPGQEDIGQYLNPYRQEVLENTGRLASRNLIENILPKIQSNFIGAGQYGSSQHQNLTNRAIRDTQEGLNVANANILHGGFNTALQAAQNQKTRQLEAGQLSGQAGEKQASRQLQGAEALQNLAGAEQQQGLRGIAALNQVGGQQQQQEQNLLNVPYQEFQRELEFPYYQQAHLTSTISGLPSPGVQQFSSSLNPVPPTSPQASPYSQAGGLTALYAGTANQRQGYAKGGVVKQLSRHRHYAEGGSLSPIQSGANAAMDTAELKYMREQATNLSRPQIDPFWAAIARGGASIAANRQPGVLANLGQAAGEGLNEYHSQLGRQDQRGVESARIMEIIDNTKRLQEHRNQTHALEKEKLAETQKYHQGQFGLQREKLEHEKSLYEQGLKGSGKSTKTSAQLNAERKANQEQLKEWGNRISRGPEVVRLLDEIRIINDKVKTGGKEAFLNEYKIGEPIANFLKSRRVGKETVNKMDALTKKLEAARIALLTGKQSTVAHQQTIKETKPRKEWTHAANEQTIKDDLYKEKRDMEEADFGIKMFNKYKDPETDVSTINSAEIKNAFKKYADEKYNWEETHDSSIPFDKTPEEYLELSQLEGTKPTQESADNNDSDHEEDNDTLLKDIHELIR